MELVQVRTVSVSLDLKRAYREAMRIVLSKCKRMTMEFYDEGKDEQYERRRGTYTMKYTSRRGVGCEVVDFFNSRYETSRNTVCPSD